MRKTHASRQGLLSGRWLIIASVVLLLLCGSTARASEADLAIPNLWEHGTFTILGQDISAGLLLLIGSAVICGTLGFSLYLRRQIHKQENGGQENLERRASLAEMISLSIVITVVSGEASLRQLSDPTFAEYYEPITGEPLGSQQQAWTAAAALEWLG